MFAVVENRLEDRQACIGVEEVNLVGVDVQLDGLADARGGTWINAGYHLLALHGHIHQLLAAQMLDHLDGSAHR